MESIVLQMLSFRNNIPVTFASIKSRTEIKADPSFRRTVDPSEATGGINRNNATAKKPASAIVANSVTDRPPFLSGSVITRFVLRVS